MSVSAFTASAIGVAWAFRQFYAGPMLPTSVFGIGSFAWLAAAAVAWVAHGRGGSTDQSVADRSAPRLHYVLLWIGLLWASLAVL